MKIRLRIVIALIVVGFLLIIGGVILNNQGIVSSSIVEVEVLSITPSSLSSTSYNIGVEIDGYYLELKTSKLKALSLKVGGKVNVKVNERDDGRITYNIN